LIDKSNRGGNMEPGENRAANAATALTEENT